MILLWSFASGWLWVGVVDDQTRVLVVSAVFQVEVLYSTVVDVGVE